jgi:putative DNA methylase
MTRSLAEGPSRLRQSARIRSHAADLNPVAVLLNICNLEIAPRWTGSSPVNPEDRKRIGGAESWRGTHGLAADVQYYGSLVRDKARKKIGHLYPKVRLPKANGGGEANVIAWIWARTVASPDPAAGGKHVPLISTYWLSSKKGILAEELSAVGEGGPVTITSP